MFRSKSVVDRPGEWGKVYDKVLSRSQRLGSLTVLDEPRGDDLAYLNATQAIIRKAALSIGLHLAVVVWEGSSRGVGDATEEFRRLASIANFEEVTILTC